MIGADKPVNIADRIRNADSKDKNKKLTVKEVEKSFRGEVVDGRLVVTFTTNTRYEPDKEGNRPDSDYHDEKKIYNTTDEFAKELKEFFGQPGDTSNLVDGNSETLAEEGTTGGTASPSEKEPEDNGSGIY